MDIRQMTSTSSALREMVSDQVGGGGEASTFAPVYHFELFRSNLSQDQSEDLAGVP